MFLITLVFGVSACSLPTKQDDNIKSKMIDKQGNESSSSTTKDKEKDNQKEVVKATSTEKIKKEWQGELIKEDDHWKKYINNYYGIEFRFRDEDDILYVYDETKEGFGVMCKNTIEKCPISTVGFNFWKYRNTDNKSNYKNLREYLDYRWNDYSVDAELIHIKKLPNNYNVTIFETKAKVYNYYKPTIEHPEKIVEAINTRYYIEYCKLKDKNYILSMCDISKDICRQALTSFKITK